MSDLESYFLHNPGRLIHKWMHYFEVYERHLSRYRGTDVHLVEIGVAHGGSLEMWRNYFGPRAKLWGIDVDPTIQPFDDDGIRLLIGDQSDRGFLRQVRQTIPRIDVVIDDGGHTMAQQRTTLEELLPAIAADGAYICEDLHTSYWPAYGGGHLDPHSYIEFSKNLIDRLNAWYSQEPSLAVNEFTRSVHSMHYYNSMLVIEKRPQSTPEHRQIGRPTLPGPTPLP